MSTEPKRTPHVVNNCLIGHWVARADGTECFVGDGPYVLVDGHPVPRGLIHWGNHAPEAVLEIGTDPESPGLFMFHMDMERRLVERSITSVKDV